MVPECESSLTIFRIMSCKLLSQASCLIKCMITAHLAVYLVYLLANIGFLGGNIHLCLSFGYVLALVWSLKEPTNPDALHLSAILQLFFCIIYGLIIGQAFSYGGRVNSWIQLIGCTIVELFQIAILLLLLVLAKQTACELAVRVATKGDISPVYTGRKELADTKISTVIECIQNGEKPEVAGEKTLEVA